MLLLSRDHVERLLDLSSCMEAVENAFRLSRAGAARSAALGLAADGGGFHAKAAIFTNTASNQAWFAAKLNANFPENPRRHGLPTIQGIVALFDAQTGVPVAIMDSAALTVLRTAAATGIAARYLARPDADSVAIIGCGAQARAQIAAVCAVRDIRRVSAVDIDGARAQCLAETVGRDFGIAAAASNDLDRVAPGMDIVITCTPSRRAYLRREHVRAGTFIAAIGADSGDKSEIDPELTAHAVVIVDDLEQCASIGDLHHAIAAGAMAKHDVCADLGQLIARPSLAAFDPTRVTLFDSTGVALEDVAAATLVYARARARNVGCTIDLGPSSAEGT